MFRKLLIVTLLLLSACPKKPLSFSEKDFPEFSTSESANLKKELVVELDQISTFKALARVSLKSGEDSQSFRQAIVFDSQDRFRLEFLPNNAAYSLALFIISQGQAVYIDNSEKFFRKGEASQRTIASVLRIPAELEDLKAYFQAKVPARFLQNSRILHDLKTSQIIVLSLKNDFVAWLDPKLKLISRFELRDPFNQKLVMSAQYSDFEFVDGFTVPSKFTAELHKDNLSIEFDFSSQMLNREIKPGLFEITIPSEFTEQTSFSNKIGE